MDEANIRLVRDQLEQLREELKAINFWDSQYLDSHPRDFIEISAWRARRARVKEIRSEFKALSALGLRCWSPERSA